MSAKKSNGGFFENLFKDLELWGIVQSSRDNDGKVDPKKAAGMAFGLGRASFEDLSTLGGMLGDAGAFSDNQTFGTHSYQSSQSWKDNLTEKQFDIIRFYNLDLNDYTYEFEFFKAVEKCLEWKNNIPYELAEKAEECDVDIDDFITFEDFEREVKFEYMNLQDEEAEDEIIRYETEYFYEPKNEYFEMLLRQSQEAGMSFREYVSDARYYERCNIKAEDFKTGIEYRNAIAEFGIELKIISKIKAEGTKEEKDAGTNYHLIKYDCGMLLPWNKGKDKDAELKRLAEILDLDRRKEEYKKSLTEKNK